MINNIKIIALGALLAANQSYGADVSASNATNKDAYNGPFYCLGTATGGFQAFMYASNKFNPLSARPNAKMLKFGKGSLAASFGLAVLADLTQNKKAPNCTRSLILGGATSAAPSYPACLALSCGYSFGKSIFAGLIVGQSTSFCIDKLLFDTDQENLK